LSINILNKTEPSIEAVKTNSNPTTTKMDLFRRFDESKLKLKLKLAEARIELLKNKKTNQIKKQKLEIANLLRENNQEELARIRTEHIVREDFNIEVLGILGLLCALVKERTKLLEASPSIPYDMKESCVTLVYAADRVTDIPELIDIKQQLMLKYKKELTSWMLTEEKTKENVNERVFEKLSVKPPNAFIVTQYMKHIAEENNVPWSPSDDFAMSRFDQPSVAPSGQSITAGMGSGIKAPYYVSDGSLSSNPSQGIVEPMYKPGSGGGSVLGGSKPGGGAPPPSLLNPISLPSVPGSLSSSPPSGSVLGSATIAAAQASKNKQEKPPSPANDFVVLNGEQPNLYPAPAPVTSNQAALPEYDELLQRFEALKRS
jgi:hypothetical protein